MKLTERFVSHFSNLKFRTVFHFYSKKFHLISIVSPRLAAQSALHFFCTPYTHVRRGMPPEIFLIAEKLTLMVGSDKVFGFRWKPGEKQNGKTILICHGFDSSSYRFADYIQPFLDLGFTILAFDAPAHGISTGKTITVLRYVEMISIVMEKYGPINAIMAHSFGALAAVLTLEGGSDKHCKQLVVVAPSTETTHAIKNFFHHMRLEERVQTPFLKLVEEMDGKPASWYSVARAIEKIETKTLWFHDKKDKITPFSDMEHLLEKDLPHIQFEITEGLGHSQYVNPEILKKIVAFFANQPE